MNIYTHAIKTNKCTRINYVLSHIINFQHVSIAFAITSTVAAQHYHIYNKLPNCVIGSIHRCNRCLILSIWSQNVSLYIVTNS